MAGQTILARRQVRLAALAALNGANLGATIDSPGDWSTPPDRLPAILLRAPSDRKESVAKTQPEFTTTVALEIEARVGANTAEAAQDRLESLGAAIEQALFTNHDLIALLQQVASVDTRTEITAEGRAHIGMLKMVVDLELFEAFDPFAVAAPPALTSVGIHVDMANPFDANGTYANPPFPDAVSPAPRTSGPDGRDEGALDITLPQ